MATAVENLNKHLQLAVRQLKIISGTVNEIPDELVDEIYGLLLSLTPREMKGPEIVCLWTQYGTRIGMCYLLFSLLIYGDALPCMKLHMCSSSYPSTSTENLTHMQLTPHALHCTTYTHRFYMWLCLFGLCFNSALLHPASAYNHSFQNFAAVPGSQISVVPLHADGGKGGCIR